MGEEVMAMGDPPIYKSEIDNYVFQSNNTLKINSAPTTMKWQFEGDKMIAIDTKTGNLTLKGFENVDEASKEFFEYLLLHAGNPNIMVAEKTREIKRLEDKIYRSEEQFKAAAEEVRGDERNYILEKVKDHFNGKKIIVTDMDELVEIMNGK
jgi:hypothetical protein